MSLEVIKNEKTGRRRVLTKVQGESKTEQCHKDRCTISKVIKNARRLGVITTNQKEPAFGDFTDAQDYQVALNKIIEVEQSFASLPAAVRSRFNNDPAGLISFLSDPDNAQEAFNLGLTKTDPAAAAAAKAAAEAAKKEPAKQGGEQTP